MKAETLKWPGLGSLSKAQMKAPFLLPVHPLQELRVHADVWNEYANLREAKARRLQVQTLNDLGEPISKSKLPQKLPWEAAQGKALGSISSPALPPRKHCLTRDGSYRGPLVWN